MVNYQSCWVSEKEESSVYVDGIRVVCKRKILSVHRKGMGRRVRGEDAYGKVAGWWRLRRGRIWRKRKIHYGRKNVFWKERHRLVVWKREETKKKKFWQPVVDAWKRIIHPKNEKEKSISEEGSRGCCFGDEREREREVLKTWGGAIWGGIIEWRLGEFTEKRGIFYFERVWRLWRRENDQLHHTWDAFSMHKRGWCLWGRKNDQPHHTWDAFSTHKRVWRLWRSKND